MDKVKSSYKTGSDAPVMPTCAQYSQDQISKSRATTESNHDAAMTRAWIQSVSRANTSQHNKLKAQSLTRMFDTASLGL